ncbi:hypothetical protein ACQVRV_00215 (plasmid) [Ralstonia pseudosolanacearum]
MKRISMTLSAGVLLLAIVGCSSLADRDCGTCCKVGARDVVAPAWEGSK